MLNPYESPRTAGQGDSHGPETSRDLNPKRRLVFQLLLRSCFALTWSAGAGVLAWTAFVERELSKDDPYIAGLFFGAISAGYAAIDFVLGRVFGTRWLRNLCSATLVAAWFAIWIYVDTQAREGHGIGTMIAFVSLAAAVCGLISSRIQLRSWILWPTLAAALAFAFGMTVASVRMYS